MPRAVLRQMLARLGYGFVCLAGLLCGSTHAQDAPPALGASQGPVPWLPPPPAPARLTPPLSAGAGQYPAAAPDDPVARVAQMEQRLQQLEAANASLLRAVESLNQRLDATNNPSAAPRGNLGGVAPAPGTPLLRDEPNRGPIYSPWRVRANDVGDVSESVRGNV